MYALPLGALTFAPPEKDTTTVDACAKSGSPVKIGRDLQRTRRDPIDADERVCTVLIRVCSPN